MQPFAFYEAGSLADALRAAVEHPRARFLAGGTTLIDLMKSGPEHPELVIDINHLDQLRQINLIGSVMRLGALSRMSEVAAHPDVRRRLPAIAEALLFAASGQLRNMASIGGNLLQRTRCCYFRDQTFPCNKREPGSGCGAIEGENRMLAVLGTSDHCIASYPGDLAVALAALDAMVYTASASSGVRAIPLVSLHCQPGDTPHIETILEPGELITHVEVPLSAAAMRSHYLKVRDRSSYEFASVSVAAAAEVDGNRIITDVRLALGGLAAKPWRASDAEEILRGRRLDDAAALKRAAQAAVEGARPQSQNAFKIAQARAAIPRAFEVLSAMPRLEDISGWSTQ